MESKMDNKKDITTAYSSFFYSSQECHRLHARVYAPAKASEKRPVVCLSGLSRNGADFHHLALDLAAKGRKVIAFDYRGRGQSQWARDKASYTVPQEAQDILAGLTSLDVHKADFIGTSRGGLIVMALAAMRPGVLGTVLLNDIGPKLENLGLMRIQKYLDSFETIETWEDVDRLIKPGFETGFSACDEAEYLDFVGAMFGPRDKAPKAQFDPALLNGLKTLDLSQPLPEIWPHYLALKNNETHILWGQNSDLLSKATAEKMVSLHPKAKLYEIEGQAHAPLTNSKAVRKLIGQIL